MAESIQEIREKLKNLSEKELPSFLNEYREDGRAGVRKLLETAERRLSAAAAEKQRMERMFSYERENSAYALIAGIDEVGRGPLAGPVCAGAVILPKDCGLLYLNDSKQLTAAKREELSGKIRSEAVAWALGWASPEEIDRMNILNATYEAMRRALRLLPVKPDLLLNDAVTIPGVDIRQIPIIKGDAKSASIAAASIVAKVARDHVMEEYESVYPGYHFASNKGYGSAAHLSALKSLGPCPIHRRSFIGKLL